MTTVWVHDDDRVMVGFLAENYLTDESYGEVSVCIGLLGELERAVMVNIFTVNNTAVG